MLFSNPEVAAFVRANFVAAWESVRPVPRLAIDFGNGLTLTRTVQGNVITYVCAPDGRVIDAIAGLVDPASLLAALRAALELCDAGPGRVTAFHRDPPPVPALAAATSDADRALQSHARVNLGSRRARVHEILSLGPVRPADVSRRLFKEVLELDLDDPFLGLVDDSFDGGAYGHP